MSDHLTRLAARSLGVPSSLEPRGVSLFEPAGRLDGPAFGEEVPSEPTLDLEGGRRPAGATKPPWADDHPASAPPARPRLAEEAVAPERRSWSAPPHGADGARGPAVSPEVAAVPTSPARGTAAMEPTGDDRRDAAGDRMRAETSRLRRRPVDSMEPPFWSRRDDEEARELRPAPEPRPGSRNGADHGPPVIHVTIGRVEVRALLQGSTPREKPSRPPASLSLEDYLRQRNAGRR